MVYRSTGRTAEYFQKCSIQYYSEVTYGNGVITVTCLRCHFFFKIISPLPLVVVVVVVLVIIVEQH